MAIGLNQVKSNSTRAKSESTIKAKPSSATPWQTFDELGPIARTVKANEAIRNAREAENRINSSIGKVINFPKKNSIGADAINVAELTKAPCEPLGFVGFIKTIFSL